MKESGWIFDKLHSMTINFYKTSEMKDFSYLKIPLKSIIKYSKQKNTVSYCVY